MASQSRPEPPIAYLVIGTIVAALGSALLMADHHAITVIGAILLVVGSSVAFVAAVAVGVEWGFRRADFRR